MIKSIIRKTSFNKDKEHKEDGHDEVTNDAKEVTDVTKEAADEVKEATVATKESVDQTIKATDEVLNLVNEEKHNMEEKVENKIEGVKDTVDNIVTKTTEDNTKVTDAVKTAETSAKDAADMMLEAMNVAEVKEEPKDKSVDNEVQKKESEAASKTTLIPKPLHITKGHTSTTFTTTPASPKALPKNDKNSKQVSRQGSISNKLRQKSKSFRNMLGHSSDRPPTEGMKKSRSSGSVYSSDSHVNSIAEHEEQVEVLPLNENDNKNEKEVIFDADVDELEKKKYEDRKNFAEASKLKNSLKSKSQDLCEALEMEEKYSQQKSLTLKEKFLKYLNEIRLKLLQTAADKLSYTIEREAEITVDRKEMEKVLIDMIAETKGEKVKEDFGKLSRAFAAYYHMQLHSMADSLVDNYGYFGKNGEKRIKSEKIPDFELDTLEDLFLSDLDSALGKANFSLLSKAKTESLDETYLINLDIEVETEKLDTKFISRFHSTHPNQKRASLTDDFLIYHRGTGIDKTTDYFVMEKVEIVLHRIKTIIEKNTSKFIPNFVKEYLKRRREAESKPSRFALPKPMPQKCAFVFFCFLYIIAILSTATDPPHSEDYYHFSAFWGTYIIINANIIGAVTYTFLYDPVGHVVEEDDQNIKARKASRTLSSSSMEEDELAEVIERVRLDQFPLLPSDCFKKHTLQEPTFKDLILIYRDAGSTSIKVKRFVDIPLADMELIFPAKTVKLNMTDTLIFLGTLIGGLVALIGSSVGDDFEEVMYSALLGVVALVVRAGINFSQQQAYYDAVLTKTLYDKQISSGSTTLIQLVNDCEEQEIKEALLAFFMLSYRGSMKEEILDYNIESLLREKFKQNIDFEVADALDKLVSLNLVGKSPGGVYSAKPIEEAIQQINAKWSDMDIGMKKVKITAEGSTIFRKFF